MWDEKKEFMLSSKYQPLDIGNGETGYGNAMTKDTSLSCTYVSNSSRASCGTLSSRGTSPTPSSRGTTPPKKWLDSKENMAD